MKTAVILFVLTVTACGLGADAHLHAQTMSPYHAPHLPSWSEAQRALGNGDPAPATLPARHDPRCELPEAPPDALMVQLSVREGASLSTATIGSQNVETGTAQVTIEEGLRPLYLVISSHNPVIWRFTGAVERVQRLILSSEAGVPGKQYDPMPLVGEIGVPQDRVFTVRRIGCLHAFDDRDSGEAASAAEFVHHQSGRVVELQIARRWVSDFSIPSGRAEVPDGPLPSLSHVLGLESPKAALEYELFYRWPAGIVTVAADRVVASRPVESYRVLPGAAGLQQLVRGGAIVQVGRNEFAVRRAFHFPAGISDGVNATFLLGKQYGTSPACIFTRNPASDTHTGVICN